MSVFDFGLAVACAGCSFALRFGVCAGWFLNLLVGLVWVVGCVTSIGCFVVWCWFSLVVGIGVCVH